MTGSPLHHSLDYIELVVTDLEKSKDFFREAFGWGFHDYGPGYAGIVSPRDDGNESGGLMLADEPRPVGGPLVLLYSEDLGAPRTQQSRRPAARSFRRRTSSPVGDASISQTRRATSSASGPHSRSPAGALISPRPRRYEA